MVKCSYCGNMHDDSEIDEENFTCHQCGMPIGYAGEYDESDEEEVNEFFDDFDDPDALTDEDLTELFSGELQGIDDIDDEEFEDDDFDDEEEEEDY